MVDTSVIEDRLRSLTLDGIPCGDWLFPDYTGYSICRIPNLVTNLLGKGGDNQDLLSNNLREFFPATYDKVVLLILDGLGFYHLRALLQRFPDLNMNSLANRGLLLPLSSVFPSTTATALTSCSTGLTPQEHGMVGYRLYLKEIPAITNMLKFSMLGNPRAGSAIEAGIDLSTLIPGSTVYERLAQAGVTSHVIIDRQIATSGLSTLLYSGSSKRHGTVTFSDTLVTAKRIMKHARGKLFLTIYWSSLDTIAHLYGPKAPEYASEFRTIDTAIERELCGGTEDALLLITSDHGFVPMDRSNYVEIDNDPPLMDGLLFPPLGEPRASYLYVQEGRKEELAELANEQLDGDLLCVDAHEALNAGLFGRGQARHEAIDRIGDLLIISTGKRAILHPYKDAVRLKGMHGGLTAEEMLVPLIASPI